VDYSLLLPAANWSSTIQHNSTRLIDEERASEYDHNPPRTQSIHVPPGRASRLLLLGKYLLLSTDCNVEPTHRCRSSDLGNAPITPEVPISRPRGHRDLHNSTDFPPRDQGGNISTRHKNTKPMSTSGRGLLYEQI